MTTSITSIRDFKLALNDVWSDITQSCQNCEYPDCMGYIWVVEDELDEVLSAGAQVVQINNRPELLFLDVYPRDENGHVQVGTMKPLCPYRDKNGMCSIHASRPLACYMYPLGADVIDDIPYWVLHNDCEYVQKLIREGLLDQKVRDILSVLDRLDEITAQKVRKSFLASEEISYEPEGPSSYQPIREFL